MLEILAGLDGKTAFGVETIEAHGILCTFPIGKN